MLNACLILIVILFIVLYLVKNKQQEVKESFMFGRRGFRGFGRSRSRSRYRAPTPPPCDNSKQGTYNSKVNSHRTYQTQVSNLN